MKERNKRKDSDPMPAGFTWFAIGTVNTETKRDQM